MSCLGLLTAGSGRLRGVARTSVDLDVFVPSPAFQTRCTCENGGDREGEEQISGWLWPSAVLGTLVFVTAI